MIEKTMKAMGFNQEETRAYISLLGQNTPITAGDLAKKTGIPRASLYGFLSRLLNHGLIYQSYHNNVKVFACEPPEKINLLFDQEIKKLKAQQKDFKDLLPQLQTQPFLSPKITFFEGIDGVKHVLNDMLIYRNIETYALWPIKEMMETLSPDFFKQHNIHRIQSNISVRAIWPKNALINVKKYPFMGEGHGFLREIRLAPDDLDYTMGYWIYNDKIAYLSSQRENYGFIIESRELVQTTLAQFNFIWSHAKKVKAHGSETDDFLKNNIF